MFRLSPQVIFIILIFLLNIKITIRYFRLLIAAIIKCFINLLLGSITGIAIMKIFSLAITITTLFRVFTL